jgi:hypothetical protein
MVNIIKKRTNHDFLAEDKYTLITNFGQQENSIMNDAK